MTCSTTQAEQQARQIEEITQWLERLSEPGQIVELRIPKVHGRANRTDSGYFDNPHSLAKAAVRYIGRAPGIYWTLNPVNPALFARAANRVEEYAQTTTADGHVLRRRWLPIDLDPHRPSGISSTEQEHTIAHQRAQAVRSWLAAHNWPAPVYADSGNGAHLLYRIDLPNDPAALALVQACLQVLAMIWDDDTIEVDTTVSNASRISKLYGSLVAKGDHTAERPHRWAKVLEMPDTPELVTVEQLRALANLLPATQPEEQPQPNSRGNGNCRGKSFDLAQWIAAHNLDVRGPREWNGGKKWVFNVCPWNPDHRDGSAFIVQHANGAIAAGCHHNGCSGKGWPELRSLYEETRKPGQRTAQNSPAVYPTPAQNGANPLTSLVDEAEITAGAYNPWPYVIEAGRLVQRRKKVDKDGSISIESYPLADFYARIESTVINEEGCEIYKISGQAIRGGCFSFEISALDYGDGRKLTAALEAHIGPYDAIYVGQGQHMGPAIKKLTHCDIPQVKRYERTGWEGNRFLIPGREPHNVEIALNRKLPYRIDAGADLTLGLEALEELILSMGEAVGTIVFATLFQAPLAHHAGWRNERYGLFIKGRTGSLKTSNLQAAMCLYSPDFQREELLIKWGEGATRNAVMSIATGAHDMPLLIDNYKPSTGQGSMGFVNLMHNFLEGSDKDRLNRAAELRETKPIYAWPVCTGEDLPTTDPASLARILVVPFAWQRGEENPHLTRTQELDDHLCAVGNAWLDWLETPEGQAAARDTGARLAKYRQQWAEFLRKIRPDMVNILRVATNLATNQLAWATVAQHPQIGPLARRYLEAHTAGLKRIAVEMSNYTAESLEAIRYLGAVREMLAAGQVVIVTTDPAKQGMPGMVREADLADKHIQDRVIGYADGNGGAYLLPDIARRAVDRLIGDQLGHIENRTLFAQLHELGMISTMDPGRHTKKRKIGGIAQNMLHLKREALQDTGGNDEV